MKKLVFALAASLPMLAGAVVVAPHTAFAANAKAPYKNVNKANDKGNDTGDAAVEKLNDQELAKIKTQ